MPRPGKWREVLNSDAAVYGGSNVGNLGGVLSEDVDWHNQSYSAEFTLPPMSIMAFRPERKVAVEAVEISATEESKSKATAVGDAKFKARELNGRTLPLNKWCGRR